MASLDNYLNIPGQERQALSYVVTDADQTVEVYRRGLQGGTAGLTTETRDERFLRTTRVRIDSYESRSADAGSSPIVIKPIALTNDVDVRRDDLWRLLDVHGAERWYRVTSVTRLRAASRVTLEETKR